MLRGGRNNTHGNPGCEGPSTGFFLIINGSNWFGRCDWRGQKNNSLVTLVNSGDFLLTWPSHVSKSTLLSTNTSTRQSRISDGRAFKVFTKARVSLVEMFRSLSWSFQKSRQDWLPPGRWKTHPQSKPEASVDKESQTCFSSLHGNQSCQESKKCQ